MSEDIIKAAHEALGLVEERIGVACADIAEAAHMGKCIDIIRAALGETPIKYPLECPTCVGAGDSSNVEPQIPRLSYAERMAPCPDCGGTGRISERLDEMLAYVNHVNGPRAWEKVTIDWAIERERERAAARGHGDPDTGQAGALDKEE